MATSSNIHKQSFTPLVFSSGFTIHNRGGSVRYAAFMILSTSVSNGSTEIKIHKYKLVSLQIFMLLDITTNMTIPFYLKSTEDVIVWVPCHQPACLFDKVYPKWKTCGKMVMQTGDMISICCGIMSHWCEITSKLGISFLAFSPYNVMNVQATKMSKNIWVWPKLTLWSLDARHLYCTRTFPLDSHRESQGRQWAPILDCGSK